MKTFHNRNDLIFQPAESPGHFSPVLCDQFPQSEETTLALSLGSDTIFDVIKKNGLSVPFRLIHLSAIFKCIFIFLDNRYNFFIILISYNTNKGSLSGVTPSIRFKFW